MERKIGDVVTIEWVTIKNDIGGTTHLHQPVQAKITDFWYDYETGEHYVGELIHEKDVAASIAAGKTGLTPEDFKKDGEDRYKEKVEYVKTYNPKIVYFCDSNGINEKSRMKFVK